MYIIILFIFNTFYIVFILSGTCRSTVIDDPRRKNVLQLCQSNYERAARLFMTLEHPSEYLRVQLERVAVLEFQAESMLIIISLLFLLKNLIFKHF